MWRPIARSANFTLLRRCSHIVRQTHGLPRRTGHGVTPIGMKLHDDFRGIGETHTHRAPQKGRIASRKSAGRLNLIQSILLAGKAWAAVVQIRTRLRAGPLIEEGRTSWTYYTLFPLRSKRGRAQDVMTQATLSKRGADPSLRNDEMSRAKNTCPPRASNAPLRDRAGKSASVAKAAISPPPPETPAEMSPELLPNCRQI